MNTPVFNQQNPPSAPVASGTVAPTSTPVPPTNSVSSVGAVGTPPSAPLQKKKSLPLSTVLGLMVFVLVSMGAATVMYLNNQNQDLRQQASEGPAYTCGSPNYCASAVECESGTASGTCGSGQVCCKGGTGSGGTNNCAEGSAPKCEGTNRYICQNTSNGRVWVPSGSCSDSLCTGTRPNCPTGTTMVCNNGTYNCQGANSSPSPSPSSSPQLDSNGCLPGQSAPCCQSSTCTVYK